MFKTGIIKYCLLAFFALFFLIIKWQTFATSLMPGDLFVITVNSNPDLVEFVSRVDMITGTKIYLSDDARTSGGTWRATEWYITFISSKLIPKGTKVMLTGIDTVTQFVFPAWIWTITRNNSFDLSTSSENLLAYQGTSYNQVSPSFIYWLWFWGPSTWIVTWIPTANNSYLPPSLSFWLSALNLNSNNQIQYNCTNTALLDPSFVTAYYSASNRNSGAVAYGPSPCVFDLIKPALSISLSTGQSSFTSWHILKFFVSATEAMSTGSFTCSDIVLSGSFVGTSVCNSVLEISPFNKTKFEVTVTATWNGIINMNILSGTVSDVAWNSNSPSIVISNTVTIDQTAPVVTLSGLSPMTIAQGWSYTEQGATRTDNIDGTWTIASPTSGSVNTAVIGIYVLEYNYTDTGGNISNTVTRTVNVTDQTAPVVTLNSWNMTINWGDLYSELGATWTDNVDGNGTINFPTSGTMSSFVPWIYTLEYSYTDAAWYTGTATRIVTVWNPWIPQPVNDFYNMAQDTWLLLYDITDNDIDIQYTTSWGMLIGPIHGTYIESWAWIIYYPNTGYVGVDTFVYQLCNILMECGTGLVTITIQDTQAPVVTLNSWNMTIDWGGAYTELGATWTDDIDGSWDITRPTTGSVDNYTPWLYILEYTYTDTGGNSGTAIRNVIVSSPWIPQPVDDNYSMPQDTASPLFSVTSNDINVQFITSWGILVDPLNGTYFVTSGWIFYYPNTGYVGVDTFVYQICNIYNQCGTGLVTVTVNAISSGSTPSSPLGGWAYVSQPIPNNNNPEIPTTPDIDTPGVDMNIFNPDIDSTTCFAPMDKLTVDQGNDMTQMFRIAHQMLYSYGLTTIPGTQDFMLDRKITRAEAAKFFVQFAQNVLCRQKIKTYDNRFNDIGDLYPDLQTNIILSNEYGIFYGSESNKFNPNSFITRDELIAVIMRLVTGKYDDAEWSDRAANYRINLENHTSIDLTNTTRWKLAEVIYDLYKHNKFELGDSGYLLQ